MKDSTTPTFNLNLVQPAFILLLAFLFQLPAHAQDTITLKEGNKIAVKMIEVTKSTVRFKMAINPNGPVYNLDVQDVGRIKYEAGNVDEFSAVKGEDIFAVEKLPTVREELGKNTLYLSVVELAMQNVAISYERILGPSGKFGIRVPFSVNLLGTSSNSNVQSPLNSFYYTGADFNFYPFGQGRAQFLLGPSLRVGSTRVNNGYYSDDIGGYVYSNGPVSYFSFLVQGGFVFCPTKELSFLSTFGLGSRYFFSSPGGSAPEATGTANFTLCVGYRF